MATDVLLPQWGMEMAEGTIVKWLKKEGDPIEEGELLVAIETAKLETDLESIASGILAHILVPEGTTVPIRTVLAVIAKPGEEVPRPAGAATPSHSQSAVEQQITPRPPLPTGVGEVSPPLEKEGIQGGSATPASGQDRLEVQVVPAARRLAQQNGINLSQVQGTGPRGRILIADVELAIQSPPPQAAQALPLTGMRRTIAARMMQSLQTMAQVTVTTEANLTDAMTLRDGLNRQWEGASLSPLHLAMKAAARALKEHPRLNAIQGDDQVQLMDRVHIGIAVSLTEGLITPVIRDADTKGLAQIASEARELANRTREGRVRPEEVTDGTFTITNLGVYDIDGFTPIINPPQVAILGLGRVVEKPVIQQGQVTTGKMMFLSLTFDHRVVDGAPAAQFLQAVKGYLEDPWWMVA